MPRSALLIIDVQQALCTGRWAMFDVERVIDRINVLIGKARASDMPIVFIQHGDDGPMQVGSDDWQLDARLDARPDDRRIDKTTPDAFHRTGLHDLLQSLGVERLVACGLQSEFCVDSTVRGALAHGYPVVLVSDAHSTMDNGALTASQISAHHDVTLASIDSFGVKVTTALADAALGA